MLVAADGHQQEVAHIFRIFEKVQKMKLLEQKNENLTQFFLGCVPYGTQRFLEPYFSKMMHPIIPILF